MTAHWSTSGEEFLARAAFIATAVYAFNAGFRMFLGAGIWTPSVPLGLILYTAAALCLIAAFVVRAPQSRRPQTWIAVVLLAAVVASVGFEIDFANTSYGTDAMAFAHAGAELLLEGQNPYEASGESVGQVLERFNVPETSVTRSTAGESVDRLVSYPGGHLLIFTGAVAVGFEDLRWVTLGFEVAALGLIWLVLSPIGRLFVPFALLLDSNLPIHFTSGAVTDWLWVLPLVVSALFLHRKRFGYAGLALGIACAVKQQPWFVVPFAVVWVVKTLVTTGRKTEVREGLASFLGGGAAGFLLLNLPFILWGPSSWLGGVLHPALGDLVADGQGFSILSSRGILPIPGWAYTIVLGVVAIASVWAYYRWFDRLQNLLWVIPPALLLLSHRSFHSYFVYWLPLALFWLDLRVNQRLSTDGGRPSAGPSAPSQGLGTFSLLVVAVAVVGLGVPALVGSAPLRVEEVDAEISGGVLTALEVEVANTTEHETRPVFELYWEGSPVPWRATRQATIGPNQSGMIRIEPANGDVVPPTRVNAAGDLEVVDFRVRVNDSGSAVYGSSEVIEIPPLQASVVNPTFRLWKQDPAQRKTPYGWRVTRFGESEDAGQSGPLDDGRGILLGATSEASGRVGWIETAVLQDVGSFAGCYTWTFSHTLGYTTTQSGDPVAASGVQMVQDDQSLWLVPSDVAEERVTRLEDGTRVVEIAAIPEEWTTVDLDVRAHAEEIGIDLDRGGILKLFAAVHETIAAHGELRTQNLDAMECRSADSAKDQTEETYVSRNG